MTRPVDPRRTSPLGQDVIDDEDVEVSRIEQTLEDETGDPATAAEEPSAPEEITGRAARTDDDLTALFDGSPREQLADAFRTGTDDDEDVSSPDTDQLPGAPD